MSLFHVNKNPSQRDLFWFGALLPVFAALVGSLLIWRHSAWWAAYVVWTIAAILSLAFAMAPAWRRRIYVGWMYVFAPLGAMISALVLVVVFYLAITPWSFVMRLFGYDPLKHKFDPQAKSYWQPKTPSDDPKRYLRQF